MMFFEDIESQFLSSFFEIKVQYLNSGQCEEKIKDIYLKLSSENFYEESNNTEQFSFLTHENYQNWYNFIKTSRGKDSEIGKKIEEFSSDGEKLDLNFQNFIEANPGKLYLHAEAFQQSESFKKLVNFLDTKTEEFMKLVYKRCEDFADLIENTRNDVQMRED